ncbi:hypothetical protein B5V88_10485 [Heyndrickxia sporothermodurans]|uniref:hypothetical protein n=1 Tax=Heyndrickxia sporothermodurans TaxID=46224 RepID=UPI000D377D87|nr:hypothetical protein [Heyndrickxia sporothermodurans]MBL5793589.1 hypothetical protein [Heyndrickxia sporothermodurans]PTY77380.1 hypothetical protein B5V88_10485 [Heyndrickxia sporothermodurans]
MNCEKNRKYEKELSQIASFCPLPLSKVHLKRMDKEHLIFYFDEKKEDISNDRRRGRIYM